ncbi:MAG: hypothetical protein KGI02_08450 [Thaumarchaeota archaeon]|nr:hypothetical protein [Nitrososphaerota archaeon]MDE1832382.1 hypothetical protein [Nitrososphaerota archaeon]
MKTLRPTLIAIIAFMTILIFSSSESLAYGTGNTANSMFLPPLKQVKTGVLLAHVTCNRGLQLILKAEDGSPACVKPDTAQILVQRGWAKSMTTDMSQTIGMLPRGTKVDLKNISVYTCGAGKKIATFVDTGGFVNITKANNYLGGSPPDWNDFFDFVLKPNSTGYINMSFEFIGESYSIDNKPFNGSIQSSIGFQRSTVLDFFNKTSIYTIDEPYSPHIRNLNGVNILATNIENVTDHTLRLTYVIKIDASAREGTYGLGIPYTCPIELLTVGDHPYTGPILWHRGTY